ncbi:MAG TPA: DUF177 domain-containing protein [Terriglobia bacterium]|nr:DUF177 domain-containing protein [Terriglobia bacterium]
MLLTLQELELHRIVVSKSYSPGELDLGGAEFRQVGALRVNAVADLEGDEIRIRGHLAGRLESRCDRCLEKVEIPLHRDFDLRYRPMKSIAREEEIQVAADELEVGFYTGDSIALGDVVAEQVLLALPMKVVCEEDCRGLCPVCGANRNLEACHCATPETGSPFASLQ